MLKAAAILAGTVAAAYFMLIMATVWLLIKVALWIAGATP